MSIQRFMRSFGVGVCSLAVLICAIALAAWGSDARHVAKPGAARFSTLPVEAQSNISAALGRDIPTYHVRTQGAGLEAKNVKQKLAVDFTSKGVAVRSGSASWDLQLQGYGYGGALTQVSKASPMANANGVEYRRGALTEWYVNGPMGLEQGFTLRAPPVNGADYTPNRELRPAKPAILTIALALSGDFTAKLEQGSRDLALTTATGNVALHYKGLAAFDARGQELPAWLELQGEQLLLKVDDANASYPVVIDPIVQLAELTASDGVTGDVLGFSVAISGNTIVAGDPFATIGPNSDQGAAYVFVKPTSGWANMTQTAKLTASDGAANDSLGWSVSISGNTVVAGAPGASVGANTAQGAAYVFVEPANGWSDMTQTAKLTTSDGKPYDAFGTSSSISGGTAVAGAPGAGLFLGAAYVFVRPMSGWVDMTQRAELTPSDGGLDGELGLSVSIDGYGKTIVAGAPAPNGASIGKVYVFVRPTGGWTNMTQTAYLIASDGRNGDWFGLSVAVGDNTVIAGAPHAAGARRGSEEGAAYVFVEPPTGWVDAPQTAKLTASNAQLADEFGYSVATNGPVALAGAWRFNNLQGKVYGYLRPANGWQSTSHFDLQLKASDGQSSDLFGGSLALDGTTVVIGARGHLGTGAVYVFLP